MLREIVESVMTQLTTHSIERMPTSPRCWEKREF
jgi:hypothetical protein